MSDIYELTKAKLEAYDAFRKYIEIHTNCQAFEQSKMEEVDPGKPLKFNEPPKLKWEPKALAKVKEITETADGLYISANTFGDSPDYWLNELKKELDKNEKLFTYKQIEIHHPDDIVDSFTYAIHPLIGDFHWGPCYPAYAEVIVVDDRTEFEKTYKCILSNLIEAFKTPQEREIAKYSVKDKSELMTPYDIWEQNKKGELPMNTYDVAYNEKKAAAQKAYDEAMIEAKKEKEAAAQKEANENAAKTLKGMYDAYVNAGFTSEQAEKFVTIALEKVASKI